MSKSVLPVRRSICKLPVSAVTLLVAGIFLMISCAKTWAQGDLLISPLRIVFEGSKKSQEINLANVGKDSATYVISVKDIRMNEDGSFEEITVPDSGQKFAGPYLRFFPRKVTLAPNEAQVVKIQLIRTGELTAGEYRSHLYFRAVPDERPLGEKPSKKDSAAISIQLTPVFGITIPCIIRIGDYNSDVALTDLSFGRSKDSKPTLNMTFKRNGNMSVYGDVKVDYISPGGKSKQVAIAKGIGVYTPKAIRRFSVELDNENNIGYDKGKLHVTYVMQMSDKSVKNIEAELPLK
jgi:hypothetical protein